MSVYRIADLNIDIKCRYPYTDFVCREYLAESGAEADFAVSASEADMIKDKAVLPNASKPYLEFLSIYRHIANTLLDYNGFILHACVVEKGGVSYAFSAKSGTGKTTHSRLWLECFPDARIINGDKPLIREFDGKFYVYGTPWCGKEMYQVNTRSPIKSICFIERAFDNSIVKIPKNEAVSRIMPQLLMPKNADGADKLLRIIDKFIESVPAYLLRCNMDSSAALTAYNGMNGDA